MDEETKANTVINLGTQDSALVFRGNSQVVELVLADGGDDDAASTSAILATAIAMEINEHPEQIQNWVDTQIYSKVSPETPE